MIEITQFFNQDFIPFIFNTIYNHKLRLQSPMENVDKFKCIFHIQLLKATDKSDGQPIKDFKKIILIKIGSSSIKCQHLHQVSTLATQSLYSRSSQKFCPLKGIVKAYDITAQGNQIISCVGAFNTDDFLLLQGTQKNIIKDLGPLVLQFHIKTVMEKISSINSTENEDQQSVIKIHEQFSQSQEHSQQQNMIISQEKQIDHKYDHLKQKPLEERILIIESQEMSEQGDTKFRMKSQISASITNSNVFYAGDESQRRNPSLIKKIDDVYQIQFNDKNKGIQRKNQQKRQDFTKSEYKKIQSVEIQLDNYSKGLSKALGLGQKSQLGQQSSIKNKSANNSMSSLTFHQLYEEYQKGQLSLLGEQLVSERRNNKVLEQRIEKMQLKVESYKKKLNKAQKCLQKWSQIGQNFLKTLQKDSFGEYLIEFNAKKQSFTFKLAQNQTVAQTALLELLNFINQSIKSPQRQKVKISDKSVTQQIETVYQQNIQLRNQKNEQQEAITLFKKKYQILNKKYKQISTELNQRNQQLFALELKQSEISQKIKTIQGMNLYLKEKDQQMEYIISTKQNTIENLRKMLTGANNELDELEDENIHLKKTLRNCELMIQELKEEIATRDDTLEMYEERYGTIKYQKNRDLQNQINDCLRWINQESKVMHESLEETQRSDITVKKDRTLSSIVKNSEKLYGLGIDQVVKIKEQLSGLMEQVDEFQQRLQGENDLKESILSQKSFLTESARN